MRISHAHRFKFASRARGLGSTALNPTLPMPLVMPLSVATLSGAMPTAVAMLMPRP